jgi:UDP-glucose 4-epimerase
MKILITGSSGYIGGCLFEFLKKKYYVYGIDKAVPKLKKQKNFFQCNLLNFNKIDKIINFIKPDIIIHLAAKSTIDFIKKKKEYINDNIIATKNILKSLKKNKIKNFIFSSTAAVYKTSNKALTETSRLKPDNIYGETKLSCERDIIKFLDRSTTNFLIFRFFNVCSSFISLKIGEMHKPETHLIPILAKKFKDNKKIYIYGRNYNTKDKTCIRDYIHIIDIMKAFDLGIKYLIKNKKSHIINLGAKRGFSNLEIFKKFKDYFNYSWMNPFFKKKRIGDTGKLICENKLAYKILNWKPSNSHLSKIINDEIKWLYYLEKRKINRKTIY